ncbi:ComEC/Rec2 family competence protein [Bartonella sp. F02]|uniref:ComEC/Rec2 family competence protein n=1 Tax=Bartonella sp. F02 TaxID=2967262 RepID=UPI0022A90EEF|nr:ComEC/Rec2 family competence protein [Bartonella sp. F02]MCZ2328351.1 ComEC family competence protein [Bartonella sp. F02]
MLNENEIKDDALIGYLSQKKNINFIQKDDFSIIDTAPNAFYHEHKKTLLTSLRDKVLLGKQWFVNCIKKEISFGLLFVLVFVFFATGIIFYFHLYREPTWKHLVVTVILLLTILFGFRHCRKIWFITGFLFCVVLGMLAAKIETWRMSTPMLIHDVSTILTGRIVSIESMDKGKFRLKVDVLKTEAPFLHHGPKRVRLTTKYLPYRVVPGDGLYGKVRLRALSGPVRPGGYDFSFYNYFKGIGAQGIYLGKPKKISVSQPDKIFPILFQKIENLRMRMTKRIRKAIIGEEGNVSAALITGERGGISQNTNEALRMAGLAHILSISGLHMALLSGMALLVIRSFLALFPVFSSYYSSKKVAALVALGITVFYLLLSGTAVAAQRSFIMIAVMLFAVLCDRSALTMRNLIIAGMAILVVRPHEILSPSFQMSFSATAVLIAAFGWWSDRKSSCGRKTTVSYIGSGILRFILFSIVSICVSSLVAGSASGIYAAYHFSNVAPLGIISNVLALPIVSILVMPFGLIAALAMPFGLEWLPLQVMGFGIYLVIKIAYAVTAISPVLNPGFMSLSILALLSLGLVGLTFCVTSIRLFFSIFIFSGIFVYMAHSSVQLIIAENMRLVGIINNEKLYIDRYRASKFMTSIWGKSFHTNKIIKPTKYGPSLKGQFFCDNNNNVCISSLDNGLKITVLHGKIEKCIEADIIIKTFETYDEICDDATQITFTLQQLLSRGSVMMTKNRDIIWSSEGFYRPWNVHRQNAKG